MQTQRPKNDRKFLMAMTLLLKNCSISSLTESVISFLISMITFPPTIVLRVEVHVMVSVSCAIAAL